MASTPTVAIEGYAKVVQLGYKLPIDSIDTVGFMEDAGEH